MQIKIQIDPACAEPQLVVHTAAVTDEVNTLIARLSDVRPEAIAGFSGDVVSLLMPDEILRIYAEQQKVYAETVSGARYALRLRLYELEERLSPMRFVRISNSEIINLYLVNRLDLYRSLLGVLGGWLEHHESDRDPFPHPLAFLAAHRLCFALYEAHLSRRAALLRRLRRNLRLDLAGDVLQLPGKDPAHQQGAAQEMNMAIPAIKRAQALFIAGRRGSAGLPPRASLN